MEPDKLPGRTSEYLSRTSMAEGTPSYSFVDTGINYSVTESLSLLAGIYNLLDKTISYENYSATLDGRRYYLGANYNF